MKFRNKTILSTFAIMLMIVVFAPYAMGLWVKYSFEQLIYFYNSQGNFQIRIKHYHRGWFSSDAILSVAGMKGGMHQLSRLLGVSDGQLPEKLRFIIHQRIYHGPVLFHTTSHPPIRFDLAFSHSTIQAAPEMGNFIQPVQPNTAIIEADDYLTFAGDYQRSIYSSGFRMMIPKAKTQIIMTSIHGKISLWPIQRDIKGKLIIEDSEINYHNFQASMPKAVLSVDRSESPSGLWVGRSDVAIPEVSLSDGPEKTVLLQDLAANDSSNEKSGLLSKSRVLQVEKIQFNNQLIGSVYLQLNTDRLNAVAVSQLSDTYSQLFASADGEQTDQQLFTVVPALLTPSSSINLKSLAITTPHGNLSLDASVIWPTPEKSLPKGLGEILHIAEANSALRISVPLANDLIHVIATVSYTNHVIPPLRNIGNDRLTAILNAERQNAILVAFLMKDKQLPSDSGETLLALQKNHDTSGYVAELKQLVADKKITANVAKMLKAQNFQIMLASLSTDEKRMKLEKTLQMQLAEWIQAGFVVQENNEYVATMAYDHGVIKVSGHQLM